ncbi:hypothetical protein QA601_13960 [Chitinispirillales bacterium ANBcel5]|nr:hypothetical protein [Chitinispirillales bacterium ANBcel5]
MNKERTNENSVTDYSHCFSLKCPIVLIIIPSYTIKVNMEMISCILKDIA